MSSTKYTLDRYEGEYGIFLKVNDEATQKIIHRSEMKERIREGDIVRISHTLPIQIKILKDETENRKQNVKHLIQQLKNRK